MINSGQIRRDCRDLRIGYFDDYHIDDVPRHLLHCNSTDSFVWHDSGYYSIDTGNDRTGGIRREVHSWLKYDCHTTLLNENPSAIATFGQYRGNDRIVNCDQTH